MNSTTHQLDADVVIVGFGPVGKMLSVQLAQSGHRVLVIDRQASGYPLPRAVTHDSEVARILQSVGLAPDMIPDVTEPYDDMYVWSNGDGDVLVEVDWSGRGSSGWYNTYFFNQPALEDKLDEMIAGLDLVTVVRNWEVTHHEDTEGRVVVTLEPWSPDGSHDGTTGPRRVSGRYLVGADGAGSQVRQRMGSRWNDLGYFFDWLVVDVVPDPDVEFPHVAHQTCDVARPCTMVPGGPGRRRWEFMRLPHETKEELNQTPRAWSLLEPYGLTPDNARLERHSVYTFQAGWAETWRRGRVLLAGDAAHLMPPFAGQGLGAGFRDAVNLAWKLARVLDGSSEDAILDSYGPERTEHVKAFIDFSTSLGQVICLTDPDEAAERDERMMREWEARVEPPAPPRPTLGTGAHAGPHGGTLSPQGRVGIPGHEEPLRLDDLCGRRPVLVVRADALSAPQLRELERAADDLDVAVIDLVTDDSTGAGHVDVDGTYGAWLSGLGCAAALVRPDFYVLDTAAAAEDVAGLLDSFRRLSRRVSEAVAV